ncbi:30S ribosomal protein S7 [archaeon]|nr:30S ribosomal protein S7 [archaeon]
MEEDVKEKKPRVKKPIKKKQQAKPKHREKVIFSFKLFGKWEPVEVTDPSLRGYVNTDGRFLPRTEGSSRGRFHKSRMHIVERLALKMLIPGHTGKKHKLSSGRFGGNYSNVISAVEKALDIIHQKEKKNPLEVLVNAIENAALREEVVSYQKGSVIAREAVVSSPQRRVDKTLKYIAQSTYRKSFKSKKKLSEALADELLAAARGSTDSFAIKEKERIEREASGAR